MVWVLLSILFYILDIYLLYVPLDKWSEYLQTKKEFLENLEQYGVDITKMPKQENAVLGATANAAELSGTFKKLNVD